MDDDSITIEVEQLESPRPLRDHARSRALTARTTSKKQMQIAFQASTNTDDFVTVNKSRELSELAASDEETTTALDLCKRVLGPYENFLKVLGWKPIFTVMEASLWKDFVNVIYPIVVVCLILLGYIVQFAACYSRSNPAYQYDEAKDENGTVVYYTVDCYDHSISSYVILDVIHIGVYFYCFYLFRYKQTEQLDKMMEQTFILCNSIKQKGYLSQKKLTASLRRPLWIGIIWIALSFSAQTLGVAGRAIEHERTNFGDIEFTWMELKNKGGQYSLAIFMVLAFVALDVVYVGVVVNYVTQCKLLIFLIRGVAEKVTQKIIKLQEAIKQLYDIGEMIRQLNVELGIAVSLLEFLFGCVAISAWLSLRDNTKHGGPLAASAVMSAILWTVVAILPICYAVRLSNACGTIKKLGYKIRARSYIHQDAAQNDLDSFLMFTSLFDPRVKLFRVPIRAQYFWGILVTVSFVILLLAQHGVISSGVF